MKNIFRVSVRANLLEKGYVLKQTLSHIHEYNQDIGIFMQIILMSLSSKIKQYSLEAFIKLHFL